MSKQKIALVVGARPNFMKVAPILRAMKQYTQLKPCLIHTGQHYGKLMSDNYFSDLEIPSVDYNLGVGSGSHAYQTAEVMKRLEPLLVRNNFSLLIVVGDVNSTLAAALVATKLRIPIAHVEAGLRSYDWSMPEEVNRVITDRVSDFLFTHCSEANHNLVKEGIPKNRAYLVGNVMIDSLIDVLARVEKQLALTHLPYGLVTLHRPSNVDDPVIFNGILEALKRVSKRIRLFFPIHPRAKKNFKKLKFKINNKNLIFLKPLSYIAMISAIKNATLVLTDSGGVQEETTYLGIPCLTLRNSSERMITVYEGTNILVGTKPDKIVQTATRILTERARYVEGSLDFGTDERPKESCECWLKN